MQAKCTFLCKPIVGNSWLNGADDRHTSVKWLAKPNPRENLYGCSNGEIMSANKKQHAKAGDMFKINVSKLYIALAIAPIFLTNHVITNGRPPQALDPNMINLRRRSWTQI